MNSMRARILALAASLLISSSAHAGAIFPIDRAAILAGSKFDFKVEFDAAVGENDVRITVNGVDAAKVLGKAPRFIGNDEGSNAAAVQLRDVAITAPGRYTVEATAGGQTLTATWDV